MRCDPQERFWPKVREDDSGCWVWTGAVSDGYGRFGLVTRSQRAHRVAYEWLVAPVPPGLVLDHLCLNRACVNPYHLDPVPPQINSARAAASRTACRRGHEFTNDNTYVHGGKRFCRTCHREQTRLRRLAARAAA